MLAVCRSATEPGAGLPFTPFTGAGSTTFGR